MEALLAELSGLTVQLVDNTVQVSVDGLINPFESETLQSLVWEMIRSPNVIEINAFGGQPAGLADSADSFFAQPGVQRPRRTVYVRSLETRLRLSPTYARAVMGHILREYLGASRPPGQRPGRAFLHFHIPAIQTEAEIVRDLTGRAIWQQGMRSVRPGEASFGNTNVRSYGPDLTPKPRLVLVILSRSLDVVPHELSRRSVLPPSSLGERFLELGIDADGQVRIGHGDCTSIVVPQR